jgi:hypothetical protein
MFFFLEKFVLFKILSFQHEVQNLNNVSHTGVSLINIFLFDLYFKFANCYSDFILISGPRRRVESDQNGPNSQTLPRAKLFLSGLWIRIDLIRIRIQHFCAIRIRIKFRIQAKTELSKTISFSNIFEIKI